MLFQGVIIQTVYASEKLVDVAKKSRCRTHSRKISTCGTQECWTANIYHLRKHCAAVCTVILASLISVPTPGYEMVEVQITSFENQSLPL